jgi:MoaA/NifB/PqqE/SkfB family radical SAM enzyme
MNLLKALELSVRIGDAAWVRHRPFLLYYKPTARCDARCATCRRWSTPRPPREELPLETVKAMLRRFREAGATILVLWGGEPLLRDDLPEILREAKRVGIRTSMCTNALRLADRAGEVVPHLDVLLCSIDGLGKVHDELRGVDGAFERVAEGIRAATAVGGSDVKVWATVNRRDVADLEALALFARGLGVSIEFFPLAPVPGHNDDLVLEEPELRAAFARLRVLKRQGLPIRNPDRALRLVEDGARFECNYGRAALHVSHDGAVHSCETPDGTQLHPWGPLATLDPDALYRSPAFRAAGEDLRRCNQCRLPCVLELSGSLARALVQAAGHRVSA